MSGLSVNNISSDKTWKKGGKIGFKFTLPLNYDVGSSEIYVTLLSGIYIRGFE